MQSLISSTALIIPELNLGCKCNILVLILDDDNNITKATAISKSTQLLKQLEKSTERGKTGDKLQQLLPNTLKFGRTLFVFSDTAECTNTFEKFRDTMTTDVFEFTDKGTIRLTREEAVLRTPTFILNSDHQ